MRRRLVPLVLLAGCARPAEPPARVPLDNDLGSLHVPISTNSDRAQRYFDQGMRLIYAFNHAQAVASFEEAIRLDSTCAMCEWGIAYALGPNINAPMDSAGGARAVQAIRRAEALGAGASPKERDFIAAMRARYGENPLADRPALDSAFATAMAALAAKYPDDLEAATIHADARMNLRPWDYWEGVGRPRPGTDVLVSELARVIAADSTHPGACHLYIHAVEATEPRRALPCAQRLAALMPGAGHIVHMPAHIYVRIGRYDEAIELNQHATHADSTLAVADRISPTYATLYVSHNFHFLGFAAMLAGRADLALQAARRTVETMPIEGARGVPEFQPQLAFEHLILLKFGRWEPLLALPLPDFTVPIGRAVAEYAQGVALAATGKIADAEALLPVIAGRAEGNFSPIAKSIVAVAHHSLAGEIAARQKRWGEAEGHFRAAMAIEDAFTYMEPPWWIEPVRHPLGAVLLDAGKAPAAEAVYREDLARFPDNVWSLIGLQASLTAQGRSDSATTAALGTASGRPGTTWSRSHF